jgi:kynureninase
VAARHSHLKRLVAELADRGVITDFRDSDIVMRRRATFTVLR